MAAATAETANENQDVELIATPRVTTQKALRDAARGHSQMALHALAKIAFKGASEASRIAAANALLDRGFGKAKVDPEPDPQARKGRITKIVRVIVDPASTVERP